MAFSLTFRVSGSHFQRSWFKLWRTTCPPLASEHCTVWHTLRQQATTRLYRKPSRTHSCPPTLSTESSPAPWIAFTNSWKWCVICHVKLVRFESKHFTSIHLTSLLLSFVYLTRLLLIAFTWCTLRSWADSLRPCCMWFRDRERQRQKTESKRERERDFECVLVCVCVRVCVRAWVPVRVRACACACACVRACVRVCVP